MVPLGSSPHLRGLGAQEPSLEPIDAHRPGGHRTLTGRRGLSARAKGVASRCLTRAAGALSRPLLPWLARQERFRDLPARLLIHGDPDSADLIHVLGGAHGGDHVRINRGVELRRSGHAPLMFLTGSEWGIDWAERNGRWAEAHGVPRSALILDPLPGTTRAEAIALRRLVIDRHLRKVLLVTEAFHAGRAARMMQRALRGTGVEIRSCPAGAAGYPPALWWRDSAERALVLGEAARLLLARALGFA